MSYRKGEKMKKICSLMIIGLMAIMPLNIKAASKVEIACDKQTYNVQEEAVCTLKATTDEEIISVSGSLNTEDQTFEIIPTASDIWEGDAENGDIQLYTDVEKTGTFNIATMKVKIKEGITVGESQEITLSVNDIMLGNVDGVEKSAGNVTKKLTFVNKKEEVNEETNNNQNTNTNEEAGQTTNGTENEIKNPSTSDVNIVIIGLVTLIVLTGVIVGVRRLKKLSK